MKHYLLNNSYTLVYNSRKLERKTLDGVIHQTISLSRFIDAKGENDCSAECSQCEHPRISTHTKHSGSSLQIRVKNYKYKFLNEI